VCVLREKKISRLQYGEKKFTKNTPKTDTNLHTNHKKKGIQQERFLLAYRVYRYDFHRDDDCHARPDDAFETATTTTLSHLPSFRFFFFFFFSSFQKLERRTSTTERASSSKSSPEASE